MSETNLDTLDLLSIHLWNELTRLSDELKTTNKNPYNSEEYSMISTAAHTLQDVADALLELTADNQWWNIRETAASFAQQVWDDQHTSYRARIARASSHQE